MQGTVTQNSLEMLLLVFCFDSCHFNASPNEPRPDTCQLRDGSGLPAQYPRIISPPGTFGGEGGGCSGAHQPSLWLLLLTSYLPAPMVVFSYASLLPGHTCFPFQPLRPCPGHPSACGKLLPPPIHQTIILLPSKLCLGLIFNHK